jgi:hydroxymethylglutaryl-CoA lyase
MSMLPKRIEINEEGPREGFQIETGNIPTARKVELIERLSTTGLKHIQTVSFVNPKAVPGMADAEAVIRGFSPRTGVTYSALWLNKRGFERALQFDKLFLTGTIAVSASEKFLQRNQNRSIAQQIEAETEMIDVYRRNKVPVDKAFVMAAFGCNFEGAIPIARVVELVDRLCAIAASRGERITRVGLGDTMGWANPESVKRLVGAVRERWPDLEILLHLHDTRGLGIANAYAALQLGVSHFDAAVAGLGGCPFAGHQGAAGNVCTEDLVFLCEEMGIETGVDLDALIGCARLAEEIVQHPLPGSVMKGGSLRRFRMAN